MSGSFELEPQKPGKKHAGKEGEYRNYGYSGSNDNVERTTDLTDAPPGYSNGAYPDERIHISEGQKGSDPVDTRDLELEEVEDEREAHGAVGKHLLDVQTTLHASWETHHILFWKLFWVVVCMLYCAYFGYAMYREQLEQEPSIRLLWVTVLVFMGFCLYFFFKFFGSNINKIVKPCLNGMNKYNSIISWVVVIIIIVGFIVFVVVDVIVISDEPYNLVSGAGIIVYIIVMFTFSYSPAHVNWRTVLWGLGLQFVFALFILRWDRGYDAFSWLGDRIKEFLAHADAGSKFLFGDGYEEHFFAFKVLPVVIFFSSFVSIMYYLEWMQALIRVIAAGMQYTMCTTAAESLNAAGNIFIGQSEAPLMIRPMIKDMTRSELHAVMTGGFATIAGSVMAAYILFGVPANHLLSASVMSAPAALAMAKLFYPETEKSKTTAKDVKSMEKSPERNIIDAASAGASQSIALVANIAANLIAFIALLHFLDATLTWFGNRVGWEEFTFAFICSYVLYPFAFVMGAEQDDCRPVAKLLGYKTFINEFFAYNEMKTYLDNKKLLMGLTTSNNTWWHVPDSRDIVITNGTEPFVLLGEGVLSERSEVITTYALCGFANIGSIGIMIGALSAMAPSRKADIATIAIRAMIAGNVACFLTACIAGLLFQGSEDASYKDYEISVPAWFLALGTS